MEGILINEAEDFNLDCVNKYLYYSTIVCTNLGQCVKLSGHTTWEIEHNAGYNRNVIKLNDIFHILQGSKRS